MLLAINSRNNLHEIFSNVEKISIINSSMLDQNVLSKVGWTHVNVIFTDGTQGNFLVLTRTDESTLSFGHLILPEGLTRLRDQLDESGKIQIDESLIKLGFYNEENIAAGNVVEAIKLRNQFLELNPSLRNVLENLFGNISAPFALGGNGQLFLLI
jgi:hypothetical protein